MGKRNENSDLKKIKLETGTVYQTEKGGNYYFRYQINGAISSKMSLGVSSITAWKNSISHNPHFCP